MSEAFGRRFTGWAFIASAGLLGLGWAALPAKVGTYFQPGDFAAINSQFQLWIWTFRLHIFGMVTGCIALVALASQVTGHPSRVLLWPGALVACAGLVVSALGAAFYYHHGAWGAQELAGGTAAEAGAFVAALLVDTEYVTCLVRFGRVFGGLGLVLVGWGALAGRVLPPWSGWLALGLGTASMALTMGMPDRLGLFFPIFLALLAWLLGTGATVLRGGLATRPQGESP
jgi:hypothetical protein